MGDKTGIEWTDATWNPVSGCSKVSQGCKHCYAERVFPRPYGRDLVEIDNLGSTRKRAFTDVRCHPDRLDQPLRWKKPRRIFVNSMSDLFHEDVPFQFIADVFAAMSCTARHTYQVLTKRPERMLEFFAWLKDEMSGDSILHADQSRIWWPEQINANKVWPEWIPYREGKRGGYDNCGPGWPLENVWLGVSVEDQETADTRIPLLLQTPAAIRWVSYEPALGPVQFDDIQYEPGEFFNALDLEEWRGLEDEPEVQNSPGKGATIDWIVAGGESGPHARPPHPDWFRSVRDQCLAAEVPFFFKQWGEWAPADIQAGGDLGGDLRRGTVQHLHAPGNPEGFFRKGDVYVRRLGKKHAGRQLDGREWNEYPA